MSKYSIYNQAIEGLDPCQYGFCTAKNARLRYRNVESLKSKLTLLNQLFNGTFSKTLNLYVTLNVLPINVAFYEENVVFLQ